MTRFTALQDFWCDETRSGYVKGLSYQVRPDDVVLGELVQRWLKDGLVKEGGGEATLTGTGD